MLAVLWLLKRTRSQIEAFEEAFEPPLVDLYYLCGSDCEALLPALAEEGNLVVESAVLEAHLHFRVAQALQQHSLQSHLFALLLIFHPCLTPLLRIYILILICLLLLLLLLELLVVVVLLLLAEGKRGRSWTGSVQLANGLPLAVLVYLHFLQLYRWLLGNRLDDRKRILLNDRSQSFCLVGCFN